MKLAILIITLNEEDTLPISLGSIRRELGDVQVLVLDSCSSDGTRQIAEQYGAAFEIKKFEGYATQRNYGLALLAAYKWVLMLDADEEMTPELAAELENVIKSASEDTDIACFRRRDYFMGRWIRRASGYPTWFGRLVRPTRVNVVREINEEYVCSGKKIYLQSHLNHFPFSKGLSHWIARHNRYSTAEAALLINSKNVVDIRALTSRDRGEARAARKAVYMKLPFRPLIGFVYLYILRLGFLDGKPGFQYCTLRFIYECMINLKTAEQRASK